MLISWASSVFSLSQQHTHQTDLGRDKATRAIGKSTCLSLTFGLANTYADDNVAVQSPSAAAKVFGVTELLEHILIQLPTKDVLLLRRTCKAWHKTVRGSIALRQALCTHATNDIGPSTINSTLCSPFSPDYFEPIMPQLQALSSAQNFIDTVTDEKCLFNPLIDVFFYECTFPDGRSGTTRDLVYKPTRACPDAQAILQQNVPYSAPNL